MVIYFIYLLNNALGQMHNRADTTCSYIIWYNRLSNIISTIADATSNVIQFTEQYKYRENNIIQHEYSVLVNNFPTQ